MLEMAEGLKVFKRKDRQEREGGAEGEMPERKLNFQVLFRFILRHKSLIFRQSGHFSGSQDGAFSTPRPRRSRRGGTFSGEFFLSCTSVYQCVQSVFAVGGRTDD